MVLTSRSGFVRTPLVDKQIPQQAKELGISEAAVVKNVMLKDTADGEFTTTGDVGEAALFFAAFESNALTGQVAGGEPRLVHAVTPCRFCAERITNVQHLAGPNSGGST